MASQFDVKAIHPLMHQLIVGNFYALEVGGSCEKGDAIEISTEAVTYLASTATDNKIEVIQSNGNPGRCIGIAAQRMTATLVNRTLKVCTHGVILAHGLSTNDTLQPARLWESTTGGAIQLATAFLNVRGKTYEPLLANKYGTVFVF